MPRALRRAPCVAPASKQIAGVSTGVADNAALLQHVQRISPWCPALRGAEKAAVERPEHSVAVAALLCPKTQF